MLVGGITFYKTFALYEEKQEFNVLEGRIPDFRTKSILDYFEEGTETEELAFDGTEDNNLRYIGKNPNNYVQFNDELWRIIGVMNNIEDSEGNKSSLIKIIRSELIGKYAWDNNSKNNWSTASLQTYLNGEYYNSLTEDAQSMIASAIWNLGGRTNEDVTASTYYKVERGTVVYSGNPTTWTGKIALMYPSDYGYAIGGIVRNTCLGTNLSMYNTNNCYSNDWLVGSQWVLAHHNNYADNVVYMGGSGNLGGSRPYPELGVRPVLFLNSNVTIESGTGSTTSPFILQINE